MLPEANKVYNSAIHKYGAGEIIKWLYIRHKFKAVNTLLPNAFRLKNNYKIKISIFSNFILVMIT
jgi:hypothetical protein